MRIPELAKSKKLLCPTLMALSLIIFSLGVAYAQQGGAVQVLTGEVKVDGGVFYLLPNLKRGQIVYVYASGMSSNLDPFVALADNKLDAVALRKEFRADIEQAIAGGRDPLEVVPEFADTFFVAWDDDSGTGYDSSFEFTIPADGDYQLLVTGTPTPDTFGNYRVLIGLDAPKVSTGQAEPTGDIIAIPDEVDTTGLTAVVEEVTGSFTEDKRTTFFVLKDIDAGDTVYAYVEATSGDLAPILLLNDFGGKPIRSGNLSGQDSRATLEYTFDEDSRNFRIRVNGCCEDGAVTTGDYRLLVGVNAPEVLTGKAAGTKQPVIRQPAEVQVGIIMEQITGVDQKSENFGVVVDMEMRWIDPKLAFSPDECQCPFQTFNLSSFDKYLAQKGITEWPAFTLFNQQGRRDSQSQLVAVTPQGEALYVERFSATLQAPDFNFERFPFDTQQFFIRIKSVFPEEFFVYRDLEGVSALGEQLGEEEWVVNDFETSIDTHNNGSRFSFGFSAHRHLNFYIFRIFVPVMVIIIVSWFTFFLKDYGKRVDVASANLLLFIAFNFTISDSLPRLGYLTLLDTILISTFVVTALVIVFNVYLKRLEVDGKQNFANRVDKYMIWIYPVAYFVAFAIVSLFFT